MNHLIQLFVFNPFRNKCALINTMALIYFRFKKSLERGKALNCLRIEPFNEFNGEQDRVFRVL